MTRVRLLLADDHKIFLEGLRRLLEPEFDVIMTVENGQALIGAARKLRPDVVIADISMPGMNGIEAARRLSEFGPPPKIVFLSMYSDAGLVREAFRTGASGYVIKKSASSELLDAVRAALKNRFFLSPAVAKGMGDTRFRNPVQLKTSESLLTPRQLQVLQLVAEGLSIKEIADALKVSKKTAEFHKYNLVRKLGARTTAELTRYAVKHGLVELGLLLAVLIPLNVRG